MISRQQAELMISDSKTLHGALVRNGYYAPSLRSPLMSWEFMDGVRERRFWLPQQTDCKLKKICQAPPLKILANILAPLIEADANSNDIEAVESQRTSMLATAERMRKHYPDAEWMITIIYTLDPSNALFQKDFVWERKKPKTLAAQELDNSGGFFDGLPLSKQKRKGRAMLGIQRLSKIEREQLKIAELNARIKEQQARFEQQVQDCQQRIQEQEMQAQMQEQLRQHVLAMQQPNLVQVPDAQSSPILRQQAPQQNAPQKKQRSARRNASKSPMPRFRDEAMQQT